MGSSASYKRASKCMPLCESQGLSSGPPDRHAPTQPHRDLLYRLQVERLRMFTYKESYPFVHSDRTAIPFLAFVFPGHDNFILSVLIPYRPAYESRPANASLHVLMQRQHSRLNTLADVSCRDMDRPTYPSGYDEHLRHRSVDAGSSTSDSRQGFDIPVKRDRSWRCAQCGMMFPKSKLLETHARSTKHKAYRCSRDPVCTKAFGMRTAASRHEATHSTLMKHACSSCSAPFRRRDHCLEHEAICVASLPLPITRPESAQLSDSEPKATAPVSTPGRGQQNTTDADEGPIPFVYGDHSSGPSSPHYAELHNPHISNRTPFDTTSMDADSESQIPPPPIYTPQYTKNFDAFPQIHVDPPTLGRISEHISEPHQSAELYACTHHGCFQHFDDNLERQKHMREHHRVVEREKTVRDYILELAVPEAAPTRSQKRAQSFACRVCPKRFTRAFTLREHISIHTGDRPFVCTVCGKDFVRQHDRIRHEDLHSGGKRLICRGFLQNGASWGCGRRFARADALSRHFRSGTGRTCTKPLKRQQQELEEREQTQAATASESVASQPRACSPLFSSLLQKLPALTGLDWNVLNHAHPALDEEPCRERRDFQEWLSYGLHSTP